jgi:hypothetical protein
MYDASELTVVAIDAAAFALMCFNVSVSVSMCFYV